MRRQLLGQACVANSDGLVVFVEVLMNSCEHHGQICKYIHLLLQVIVDVFVIESCIFEAIVHSFEGFDHRRHSILQNDLIKGQMLKDRQIIIPKLDRSVENQPRLLGL